MNCTSLLLRAMLIALPVLASAATPTDAGRPRCDAKHLGQFWPDPDKDKNSDVQQLAKDGELAVCARTEEWRYGWQRLTITIEQLKTEPKKGSSSSSSSTRP